VVVKDMPIMRVQVDVVEVVVVVPLQHMELHFFQDVEDWVD
jgi:hypothetical protein